jgi:hypothetical protein
MKQILLTLFLSLCCLFTFSQSFEGKIVYQHTYKRKIPSLPDDKFTSMMGSVQNYYIFGGDYKSEVNGTFLLWQLYINADNKLYTKMANSETILWNDGATNPDEVTSVELHKDAAIY